MVQLFPQTQAVHTFFSILFYASITPVIANVKLRDSGNPSSETQGQLAGRNEVNPAKSEGQKFS